MKTIYRISATGSRPMYASNAVNASERKAEAIYCGPDGQQRSHESVVVDTIELDISALEAANLLLWLMNPPVAT